MVGEREMTGSGRDWGRGVHRRLKGLLEIENWWMVGLWRFEKRRLGFMAENGGEKSHLTLSFLLYFMGSWMAILMK